jgi:hypothetical protein
MRKSAPLLAVVIAIGIAATVDALRSGGEKAAPEQVAPEPTTTRPVQSAPSPADEFREAGVSGTVFFTVRSDEGCELHALMLPDLAGGSFLFDWCRFDVSSEGTIVAGPRCPGRAIEVREVGAVGGSSERFRGCAPAWKPNGQLTFVRDGDVVTPTKTLVRDAARFARQALGGRLSVREFAWLSNTKMAVLVASSVGFADVIVIIEGGRQVSEPIYVDAGSTFDVSQGSQEILSVGRDFGVQVYDWRGAFVAANRFTFSDVGAVAHSPEGRWVALARPGNICIYEDTEPPPRIRTPIDCLPFEAIDLAWR